MENLVTLKKSNINFFTGIATIQQCEDFIGQIKYEKLVAIVGRSNVGKSSLINALFSKKIAFTSNTPGKTKQINIFKGLIGKENFILMDLPGYGHATVSKKEKNEWQALMDYFFENLPQNTLLLMIQDARHPLQKTDVEFISYVKSYSFVKAIVFNKYDKLKTQKERSAAEVEIKKIQNKYAYLSFTQTVSAIIYESLEPLAKKIVLT